MRVNLFLFQYKALRRMLRLVAMAMIAVLILSTFLNYFLGPKIKHRPMLQSYYWQYRNEKPKPPFGEGRSVREMLSEELDYSLDQVSYFQRNSDYAKANGVLLGLVRNSELDQMIHTVKEIERSFNSKYHYPYLFLNDVPFTEEFKLKISALTNAKIEFGLIPKEHWSIPDWIDKEHFKNRLLTLQKQGIIYGGLESYRHMCRFNSGFFYKHELIQKYDYYWRIEPDVDYPCNLSYDPFAFMKFSKKKYGFNIVGNEFQGTVVNLWNATKSFTTTAKFLGLFGYKNYNGIHFWSNFEIGDLNWFRSKRYNDYFNHLDRTGNFFYERWGDAPVHSIAAGLLLDPSEVHYFLDIGYRHSNSLTCPIGKIVESKKYKLDCSCDIDLTDEKDYQWAYISWRKVIMNYLNYIRKYREVRNRFF